MSTAPRPSSRDEATVQVHVHTEGIATPMSERPGSRVGQYELVELIGDGGMGYIWRARQRDPVHREVAIKFIKLGLDTKEVLARFDVERQALAVMDHPYVARVFDAGSTEYGRPYFVMEYIKGVPITEYCDRNRLTLTERLELFRRVCEGVQHAHQKAIVHRDLKPSNILVTVVDGVPQPKIIDFGVAKAAAQGLTAQTVFTQRGQLIGTPEYLSPEQAGVVIDGVDTRSDVYSLGVVLYELLVGALPFERRELHRAGYDEICRILREQEPPKPSTRLSSLDESGKSASNRRTNIKSLSTQVRGDLDWITMKALEKNPQRRYGSPSEFAADIGRYLSDEPVLASPPSPAYRARKFARRHRGLLAATLTVAFATLLGLSLATVGFVSARRSAEHAEGESAKYRAINGFMREILTAADPTVGPGPTTTVVDVLSAAGNKVDAGALAEEPLVEASVRDILGRAFMNLGVLDAAEANLQSALEIRRRVLGRHHAALARSLDAMGRLAKERGQYKDAERLYRTALDIVTPPEESELPYRSGILNNLALLIQKQGRDAESVPYYEEAMRIDEKILEPNDPNLAATVNNVALLKRSQGDREGAEELFREALRILRAAHGEEHVHIAAVLESIGSIRVEEEDFETAESLYQNSMDMRRRIVGDRHVLVAHSMNGLGRLYTRTEEYDRAETLYRDSLQMQRELLGESHPRVGTVLNNLGMLLTATQRYDEGERAFREAMEIRVASLGDTHRNTLLVRHNLANLTRERGDATAAEKMSRHVVDQALESDPEHWYVALFRGEWGMSLSATGRAEEAERELLASYDGLMSALGDRSRRAMQAAERLAEFYQAQGREDDAATWQARA